MGTEPANGVQSAPEKSVPIYLRFPRRFGYGLVVLYIFIDGLIHIESTLALLHYLHKVYLPWELFVLEYSGGVFIVAAVPLIIAFDRRLPISWHTWRFNIFRHAAATLVFSAYLTAGTLALRKLMYAAFGSHFLVEIHPLDTGDASLILRDGTAVPCSRNYRSSLRTQAASQTRPHRPSDTCTG
jgi:hypothetical protein